MNSAKIRTDILLTSRTVYREAKAVILYRAQLVRIRSEGVLLTGAILKSRIPIYEGPYSKLCIMTHEMVDPDGVNDSTTSEEKWDFYVPGKDLDHFYRRFMGEDNPLVSPRSLYQTIHTVTLWSPFGEGDPFINLVENQRRLLKPCREILRGLKDFAITGDYVDVDEGLATAVAEEVRQEDTPSGQEFLDELNRIKEAGNRAWRAGQTQAAFDFWCKGLNWSERMAARTEEWAAMRTDNGDGFTHAVVQAVFQLLNNQLAAFNLQLRQLPNVNYAMATYLLQAIISTYNTSTKLAVDYGAPGWGPDRAQAAKMSYRAAVGIRLAGGQPQLGYQLIDRALLLAPDDAQVRREYQEYMRLRRAGGP